MKTPLRTLRDSGIPNFSDLKDAFKAVSNIYRYIGWKESMGADVANKNSDCERQHNQRVIFLITCPLWNTVILQQLRDTTIPAVFV